MTNLDLVYSLFNQFLFQEVKNNIEEVEYYFSVNANTSGNPLVEELLKAIKTYNLDNIDIPLFNSILARTGKTPAESNKILSEIIKWKGYSKKQIEPAKKFLDDIIANSIIQKANRLCQDSPSDFLKYIKNVDYKTYDIETLNSVGFNQLDINSIIADKKHDVIPSYFDFVNKASSGGGYDRSQIILFCQPPGGGKSLQAQAEALFMASHGYKVNYLCMGDMQELDFIVRMGAIYSGLNFKQVKENLPTIYNGLSQLMGNNLDLIITAAGVVTVDEYVDYMKDKDYDVLIIDYDGNFKANLSDNTMYSEYGYIYEKLTRLSMAGKLLIVLSQPKVGEWRNPTIDLAGIGESSRKQQQVDQIITRGREPDCPNPLGIFKIVKNRRGEVGSMDYSIRLENGRFISIPKGVYNLLKQETERKLYTEADIQGMINSYNANNAQIQQQLNQAANRMNNNGGGQRSNNQYSVSGPTPFSRP